MDSRLRHFGAYNRGMLPSHGAADIAARVVAQHQADQDIFAALTDFVKDVEHEAGSDRAAVDAPSHALRNLLITFSIILLVVVLGFFLIGRPIHKRREQELKEAKSAAQDDLIALSAGITGHHADISIQSNPEVAEEQSAALSAYERGTLALDAARRPRDMGQSAGPSPRASIVWPAQGPLRPGSLGPTGVRRASSIRSMACRSAMSTGRLQKAGPATPSRCAPLAHTRSSRVSSPTCAR
jgi:preprotein translocase subunit YajC